MSCETARLLMERNDPALAEHVSTCLSCLIGNNATYYEAPPGLEKSILRNLRRDGAGRTYWRWAAIAASVLLAVSIATNIELFQSRVSQQQLVAEAVLSAHLRSLTDTHLVDVPSSDQHTVKPWFNGKLDFSPRVETIQGFPLLGGRLEYLDARPVAALIYGRSKHIINLFTWPTSEAGPERSQTRNGYHMQSWFDNGMTFWAVSDLNEGELRTFVSLYRQDKH
jgi:anti-sigma factor RsiW